jgi:hypothetical protein
MAWLLDGNPVADNGFTKNEINYPANWIRGATPAERAAIGISAAPVEPYYDQRFYWGFTPGTSDLIPKAVADLKKGYLEDQKNQAASLLAPYDWYVIRNAEKSTAIPANITTYRDSVRTICAERETQITNCSDTDALYTLITTNSLVEKFDTSKEIFDTSKEKFDTTKEKKDGSGNSFDPKQYESFDPKQYESFDPKQYEPFSPKQYEANPAKIKAWPALTT